MIRLAPIFLLALAFAACKRDDMADQPRGKPLAHSDFFPDNALDRQPVPGTVARNAPTPETPPANWWDGPALPDQHAPFIVTDFDMHRGQQQFNIFCTPCHGEAGDGNGAVPARGFLRPPTYHSDRLRNASDAYVYNVITNGIGAMYPYADRIPSDDRWRIVAYIRALQLSQHALPADLTAAATQGGSR